jgi:hypothetical protein
MRVTCVCGGWGGRNRGLSRWGWGGGACGWGLEQAPGRQGPAPIARAMRTRMPRPCLRLHFAWQARASLHPPPHPFTSHPDPHPPPAVHLCDRHHGPVGTWARAALAPGRPGPGSVLSRAASQLTCPPPCLAPEHPAMGTAAAHAQTAHARGTQANGTLVHACVRACSWSGRSWSGCLRSWTATTAVGSPVS